MIPSICCINLFIFEGLLERLADTWWDAQQKTERPSKNKDLKFQDTSISLWDHKFW